jgi:hypothetical protein
MKQMLLTLVISLLAAPFAARAAEVDPATLYTLSTEGTSASLASGAQGTYVLTIQPKEGAYLSDETPFKLQLTGDKVKPAMETLKLTDSVNRKAAGQKDVAPRFEVPLTAGTAGAGKVDAKVTFFICTEKLCARQVRTVSAPIAVK